MKFNNNNKNHFKGILIAQIFNFEKSTVGINKDYAIRKYINRHLS